jgi:hypothetical protein
MRFWRWQRRWLGKQDSEAFGPLEQGLITVALGRRRRFAGDHCIDYCTDH